MVGEKELYLDTDSGLLYERGSPSDEWVPSRRFSNDNLSNEQVPLYIDQETNQLYENIDGSWVPSEEVGPSYFKAGIENLKQGVYGLQTGIASSLGLEDMEAESRKKLEGASKAAERLMVGATNWRDIRGAGDVATFALENFGASAPETGLSLGGWASGSIAGGIIGGPVGAAIGGALGTVLTGLPLFTGHNVARQIDEGKDVNLARAAAFALPQASADIFLNKFIGSRAFNFVPTDKFIKNFAKSVGEAVAIGAPTEALQQGLERAAAELSTNPITDEAAAQEYLDSFFAGAAAGSIPGAAAGAASSARGFANKSIREDTDLPIDYIKPEKKKDTKPEDVLAAIDETVVDETVPMVSPEATPETTPDFDLGPTRAEVYSAERASSIPMDDETTQALNSEVKESVLNKRSTTNETYLSNKLDPTPEGATRLYTIRPRGESFDYLNEPDGEAVKLKGIKYTSDLKTALDRAEETFGEGNYEVDSLEVPTDALEPMVTEVPNVYDIPRQMAENSLTVFDAGTEGRIKDESEVITKPEPKVKVSGGVKPTTNIEPQVEQTIVLPKRRMRAKLALDENGRPILNEQGLPEVHIVPANTKLALNPDIAPKLPALITSLNKVVKATKPDSSMKKRFGTVLKNMADKPDRVTNHTSGVAGVLFSALPDSQIPVIKHVYNTEAWYALTSYNDVIKIPQKDLEAGFKQLTRGIAKHYKLNPRDVITNPTQTLAEGFSVYMQDKNANLGSLKKYFKEADTVLNSVRKALENEDINNASQIIQTNGIDAFNNIVDAQVSNLKKASKDYVDSIHDEMGAYLQESTEVVDDAEYTSMLGRWFNSANFVAARSALFAGVHGEVIGERDTRQNWQHDFATRMAPFYQLYPKQRNGLMKIALENRRNNTKAYLNSDGYLVTKGKGGTRILRDARLSNIYMQVQDVFKDVAKASLSVVPNRTLQPIYSKYGLGVNPSREALERATSSTKMNPTDKAILEQQATNLETLENLGSSDYVPLVRLGRRKKGITVKNKDGELLGFFTYEVNKAGKPKSKTERNKALEQARKLKMGDKGHVMSSEFLLTKNSITNRLPSNSATLETLATLLDLDDSEVYGAMVDSIAKETKMKGFLKHYKDANFVEGFSTDWDRALPLYLDSAASYLAKAEYTSRKDVAMRKLLDNTNNQNLIEFAEKFIDLSAKPQDTHQWIRTFQFFQVLGYNISSGLVQFASIPTTLAGTLSQFTGSHLGSSASLLSNLGEVVREFKGLASNDVTRTPSLLDITNKQTVERLVKSGKWSQEKADFYNDLIDSGMLLEGTTPEALGVNRGTILTSNIKDSAKGMLTDVVRASGIFMSTSESSMRAALALSMFDYAAKDSRFVERAHQMYSGDGRYRQLQLANKDLDTPNLKNLFRVMSEESLGAYGKYERAPYQNNIVGAIILPFSTYIHRAAELIFDMAVNRGAVGKKAAITTLASFAMMAGVWGLPGMETVKWITEMIVSLLTGEDTDLDETMREFILDNLPGELGPLVAQMLSKGTVSTALGADLSKRIGLGLPGEELLSAIKRGGVTLDRFGVPGGFVTDAVTAGTKLMNGEDLVSAVSSVAPRTLREVYEANVQWSNQGITSGGANPAMLRAPEDISVTDKLKKSIGFNPLSVSEAKTYDYRLRQKGKENIPGKRRFAKKLENAYMDILKAQRGGTPSELQEARKKFSELDREYSQYLIKIRQPEAGRYRRQTLKASYTKALSRVDSRMRGLRLTKQQQASEEDLRKLYRSVD